jgi:UDP-N-acetylmuramate dehydrogenase
MDLCSFKKELERIVQKEIIRYDEPMKNHTSFKLGGPVDVLIIPEKPGDIVNTLKNAKNITSLFYHGKRKQPCCKRRRLQRGNN